MNDANHDTIDDTDSDFELIQLSYQQEETNSNPRLDQYLAEQLPDLSRVRVKKLIDDSLVTIDGARAKASLKLKGGESIELRLPPLAPSELVPEDLNLNVVFEDESLIVINKPAGMITHPGAGVESGTLVNGLLHHCKGSLSGISGEERPGIVHRLDKDTTGLLVVAKNDQTHRSLAQQIATKTAKRKYVALVQGIPKEDSGVIEESIGRHPVRRKEMCVCAPESGRKAKTIYKVRKHFNQVALVDLELKTGRTHQIRVHMAHIGNPVLGDLVYNKKGGGTDKARKRYGLKGHALHATSLSFTHPETGQLLEFSVEPPDDFGSLINRLEKGWR